MGLITYAFTKLETAKVVVREMSKNPRLRTPFNSQHFKWSQICAVTRLSYFLVSLMQTEFKNVSLSDV